MMVDENRSAETSTTEVPSTEIRLLHVDDDDDFADMVAVFLEHEEDRFVVETATSPTEAYDRLAETDFDCIVSDHDMPDQTGIEFLETVRETDPDIPFVLFTGKGSEEVASRAIAAGVSDYLQKESGTEQYSLLANRIKNLVAQYDAESELDRHVRQQQIVAELGQVALTNNSIDAVFEQAVEAVSRGLGTEFSKILEYRPSHEDVLLRAGVGWADVRVGETTIDIGDNSQAGHTLRTEEPIVVTDLRTENRFRGPALLSDHRVVSGVSVIIGSPDDPWGVLGTHTTEPTRFSDDDVNFVQSVANVLATAIDRKASRERDRRQRILFERSPDMVDMLDADGRILEVNRRFCAELGYDEADLLGRPIWEFDQLVDADAVRELLADFSSDERRRFEGRYERRDGSTLPVEVHLLRLNLEGEDRFLAISRDVTERVAYEQQFNEVLEASPDAVIVVGRDGAIRQANRHVPDVVGFSPAELEGKAVEELLLDEDREDHVRLRSEYMQSPEPRPMGRGLDLYARHRDGSKVPVEISLGPIERDGELYVVATISDTSERKAREETLRRQNESLEEFADVVAHDFRGPLSTITGRLELVREEHDSEHLDGIAESVDRMEALVEEILTLARAETAVRETDPVDLASVVEACWRNIETADAELVVETDRTIRAGETRLQQLCGNLLQNAVAHGAGNVTVVVGDLDDGFYVEDDGPGVPAEDRAQVFQRGYSTAAGGSGAGLGLAIVEKIAEEHGWEVRVLAGAAGGARFEIRGVDAV